MEWKRGDGHKLTVTTTTEHLAQRLGGALEKAFGGNTHYEFFAREQTGSRELAARVLMSSLNLR